MRLCFTTTALKKTFLDGAGMQDILKDSDQLWPSDTVKILTKCFQRLIKKMLPSIFFTYKAIFSQIHQELNFKSISMKFQIQDFILKRILHQLLFFV